MLSLIERTPASVHAFPGVLSLRQATPEDVPAIHALVDRHVATDQLLPRASEEIQSHCDRFVVATLNGDVVGCAELAPLSPHVAEVRSLVVEADARGMGLGRRMVDALFGRATELGYARLCAFTHQPGYFVKLGFSIVPHLWLREKVFTDCVGCPLFRGCGQQAVVVSLAQSSASSIGAVA